MAVEPLIETVVTKRIPLRQGEGSEFLKILEKSHAREPVRDALAGGKSEARQTVEELLYTHVRVAAALALARIGDKRAVDPLNRVIKDEEMWIKVGHDHVARAVVIALIYQMYRDDSQTKQLLFAAPPHNAAAVAAITKALNVLIPWHQLAADTATEAIRRIKRE